MCPAGMPSVNSSFDSSGETLGPLPRVASTGISHIDQCTYWILYQLLVTGRKPMPVVTASHIETTAVAFICLVFLSSHYEHETYDTSLSISAFLRLPLRTFSIQAAMSKQCYNSEGQPAGDYPCDPSAGISACCGGSGVCVDNLHCISGTGGYVPGTCTFEDWGVYHDKMCPCPPGTTITQAQSKSQGVDTVRTDIGT